MKYKTAIVHEWLTVLAGSEKVLEQIYGLYPSPIYTLVADKVSIKNSPFKKAQINTSFIQSLPFAKTKYKSYLPLFPLAIENFDLTEYDVILSSSHAVAKGVLKRSDQLHICCCYTPMRYIWDMYHQYLKESNLEKGVRAFFAKVILHYLRMWDISSVNRVDYFIADSKYIANRIKKIYNRDSKVIYPPVDIESFKLDTRKDSYYLTASRMVPYKKIDIVVEAFNKMPDKKLIVIGDGPGYRQIKKIAGKNIEIIGYQPLNSLIYHIQKAKAFIFPAIEDFGILPVEAQAAGTPVIAFGKGGALETVVNKKTGLFFHEQSPEAIMLAVSEFEKTCDKYDPHIIRKNAVRFNVNNFRRNYEQFVEKAIEEFYSKPI